MHLPLGLLSAQPATLLGTFGLLRRSRLALHLPLRILRGRCKVSACPVHRAGRRVLVDVRAHAGCLAVAL